jgi:cell division protein FtsN
MSDQQPSREISKTIGGMSMITLIHMAVDLMVAAALFFMLKKRTSHLQAQIDKLTEKVNEQENMLRQHHAILSQIVNGGAPLPPMRQSMPSQQEQTPMREPERQRQPVQRIPAREQQSPPPSQQVQQSPATPQQQKPAPQKKQPVITSDTEYTEGEPDEISLDAIINDEFENERDLNCDEEQCTVGEKKIITDADDH